MSDNETIVGSTDDLNEFENLFYGKATPEKETEPEDIKDEAVEDESETVDADEAELSADDEADPSETDEESDEDESEEPEDEKPRRNRKTAKERIQELNYEKKLAEQRYEDAIARLQKFEEAKPEDKAINEVVATQKAPAPDDLDKDGNVLYPMGEFDPGYIRALTRFTIEQETDRAEKVLTEKRQQAEAQAQREQQSAVWMGRLEEAEKELPDVREKIATLGVMFDGIDQNYGQYLVDVVQSLPNGPAILHYLADNPKEAKGIVNSGATVATLSLGRLDAQIGSKKTQKEEAKKVVTRAPTPAPSARGSGGKFTVPGDTDDLEAFEKVFFAKKK